jgi:hypothetical protein
MQHQVLKLGGSREQLFKESVGVGAVKGQIQVELGGTHIGRGQEELGRRLHVV